MEETPNVRIPKHRVIIEADGYFVPISHLQLDHLIGRLMQICDLTGDIEQRKALKDTIKSITREWLNDEYSMNGYDSWTGVRKNAKIITIK